MNLMIRHLGQCDYLDAYQAMKDFNNSRDPATIDEIWFLQHTSVYTLGLAGKPEHVLAPGNIPVIRSDRGGQVTYHGPGQLLAYLLIDLKRQQISIKGLVYKIEQSIIEMLDELDLKGDRRVKAPGVYISNKKIAALGIRVRNGCSYHGFCLNVDMDLSPYLGINPCGYPGLEMTRLKDQGIDFNIRQVTEKIKPYLLKNLGYEPNDVEIVTETNSFQKFEALA